MKAAEAMRRAALPTATRVERSLANRIRHMQKVLDRHCAGPETSGEGGAASINIDEAVDDACAWRYQDGRCRYPDCSCSDTEMLRIAAVSAAKAMREQAALVVDRANRTGPFQAIGTAKLIRALLITGSKL